MVFIENSQIGLLDNISMMVESINISLLFSSFFIFYFMGGYLLYSSFFACIGAAVDNESDVQQMILPITIPLILSLSMMESILNNPDGVLHFGCLFSYLVRLSL